jgi:hypothetical protein
MVSSAELQFDLEVEIQGRKLKLRRNAWEGKANLRQEYKKKVNQAGKTGVCIFLHNLAQGVEVERVHVPLGDDEEFVLGKLNILNSLLWITRLFWCKGVRLLSLLAFCS